MRPRPATDIRSTARIDLVFPRFKMLSGAERAILGLAEGLAGVGCRPRIVCHQFDPSCRPRLAAGVELACSNQRLDWSRNRYLNAVFDYVQVLRLGALLDPQADLQVFFGPALLLAWRHRRATRARVPHLYYCWEPPRALYQDRDAVLQRLGMMRWPFALALRLYRSVDRYLTRTTDVIATSSPFAARRIEDCYGRPATVITLGVDKARLDAARRPMPTASPIFITVNYLHPRKRVDLAIEALAKLQGRRDPSAQDAPILRIIGDGPERETLRALAVTLGVDDRVEFAGFVPDADLPAHYWAATAYVHTALDESFGLSVIEAAYCGRPIIAVDEGGVRGTVADGVTGFRMAATAGDLAAAMHRLLALPDRGAAMGEAGRHHIAERYDWTRGAHDLLAIAREQSG